MSVKTTAFMKSPFKLLLFPVLLFLLTAALVQRTHADTNGDWNVAVLDQVLASVPAGGTFAQVGDQLISVSYLQWWRNKLAGGPQPKVAFSGTFTPWPSGNVYYTFDPSVSASNKKAFLDATVEWATFANLHFIQRVAQANYLLVTNNASLGGGNSFVGMVGGAQLFQIGSSSWNRGTLVHELGHALGLVHEHQRSDRDSFVTIVTTNILIGHLADFVKLTDSQNKSTYDFLSVMHYARDAFSTNAYNTIQPLPAYIQYLNLMGHSDPVLSTNDRAGMAQVYGAGPAITSIVTNTLDGGPGSLRAAMYYAFDHPGTTVTFNIPVTDLGYSNNVFNILPSDGLPNLVNAMTLDATTEPINSNPNGPEILLNGILCRLPSVYPSGLRFNGTNCIARGFIINNFPNCGVLMDGSNTVGNTVSGCYLGIDPTGTVAVTNGIVPMQISGGAISNTIGGTTAAARNIISGSFFQGVMIRDAGTRFNTVAGNYIGLNATGTAALTNTYAGVEIFNGAQSNLIGGFTAASRNIISGNPFQGVFISGPTTIGNTVAGNYIGLNPAGTAAISNALAGVEISSGASGNIIGPSNVISGNGQDGIVINNTSNNVVRGNFIGLNAAGTAAIGNTWAGVDLYYGAQSNSINGGNVISGNGQDGVVFNGTGTRNNFLQGNLIGLNPAGTTAIGNNWAGVDFYYGPQFNLVGGNVPAARNIISGNGHDGVVLSGGVTVSNVVAGNFIGLNAAGTAAVSNAWSGVELYYGPQANVIGGSLSSAGNVISGNGQDGVLLNGTGTINNFVQGNLVGLNAVGNAPVANVWSGVEIYNGPAGNLIGGYGGARNFISGNGNNGIYIDFANNGNTVQGNTIGLDAANSTIIPNAYAPIGIYLACSNLIGGVTVGAANLISGSTADGIQVFYSNSTNNTIRGNSIFNNAGTAILLYSGGNNGLAAPTLSSAIVGTNTVVSGSYSGANGAVYQLDFYADAPPAASAEAMTYLGTKSVTGTGGSAAFIANLGALLPAGRAVTATATDPAGNTSQVSTGVAATMTSTPNDGIPDAWRLLYFGSTSTNSSSYTGGDPDHDGLSNYQEFLAGTNPTNAASVLKLTAFNSNTSTNAISLNSVSGVIYRVQYRDDLSTGSWNLLADQIAGTGTNIFLPDPSAAFLANRFYRAQVLW